MQLLVYPSSDKFASYIFSTSPPCVDLEWLYPRYMTSKDIIYTCYLRGFRFTKRAFCHYIQQGDTPRVDVDWEAISSKKPKKSSSSLDVLGGDNKSSLMSCESTSITGNDITLQIESTLPRSFFEALWSTTVASNESLYNIEDYISTAFCTNEKDKESQQLKFRQHHYRFYWSIISYLREPSAIFPLFSDLIVAASLSDSTAVPCDETPQRNTEETKLPTADDGEDFDIDAIVESAITHFIQTDDFGPDTVKRRNASSTIDMDTLGSKDVYQSASAKMAKLEEKKEIESGSLDESSKVTAKIQMGVDEINAKSVEKGTRKADVTESSTLNDLKTVQQFGSGRSPRRMASADIDISKIEPSAMTGCDTLAANSSQEQTNTEASSSPTSKASPRRLASAEIDISQLTHPFDNDREKLSLDTKRSPRRMASADLGTANLDKLLGSDAKKEDKRTDDQIPNPEESVAIGSNTGASNPQSGVLEDSEPVMISTCSVKCDDKNEPERIEIDTLAEKNEILGATDTHEVKNGPSKPAVTHNSLKNILDVLADLPLLKHIDKVTLPHTERIH